MDDYELAQKYETVNLYRRGGTAKIELNRPESRNAWNTQFSVDLLAALRLAGEDPGVRAVLVTGAGKAFSSGADLRENLADRTEDGPPDVYGRLTQQYHPIIRGIREMPKPVVAGVHGAAAGIGLSLALACDLVVAAGRAASGQPGARLGPDQPGLAGRGVPGPCRRAGCPARGGPDQVLRGHQ